MMADSRRMLGPMTLLFLMLMTASLWAHEDNEEEINCEREIALPITVSFSFLPDNTPLPRTFQIAGFTFAAHEVGSFVNYSYGEVGYQFPDAGVTIVLPVAVGSVSLLACGHMTIKALDSAGDSISEHQITSSECHDVMLSGGNISAVSLTGGNNEGMLARVAIDLRTCN